MLEYQDAKAVISHTDSTGKELGLFTTWRGDFIEEILKGGNCLNSVKSGDKVIITIEINKISKGNINQIDDATTVGC